MSRDGKIWLSHTGIESLQRCPRCFWLQYRKGIRQPEGIISRLANRFDTILKSYFNLYRDKEELPEIVRGKLDGKLQNPFKEKYFYTINARYGFYGKLDECLINSKHEHIPVDFKTASSDPREKETLAAYQSQIDDYIFLLQQNNLKTADYGYLIYFFPDNGTTLHQGFPMIIYIVKVFGDSKKTLERIQKAMFVLDKPMPEPSPECNFCSWHQIVNDVVRERRNTILEQKKEQLALL